MGKHNDDLYVIKPSVEVDLKNQVKIASMIGITPSTLSKILNGKRPCKKSIAYMLTIINDKKYQVADIDKYFDIVK